MPRRYISSLVGHKALRYIVKMDLTANSNKLRGAVIGYGFISSKGHLPAYLERGDVDIVAVADVCAGRRALAQASLPGVRIFNDYKSLLQELQGKLDFLDISTPPCDHAEIAVEGMKRGLHILCEKPITPSFEEALLLKKTALDTGRVFFPCHNYKHAPIVKKIREILNSGAIGKLRSVTLSTFRNTHAKGVTEWDTHWRRKKAISGGGIAMDHGSHSFYLTFDWFGEYPRAVTAKMDIQDPRYRLPPYGTEDQFSSVLTFPSGTAHCHLTWTSGYRKVMYSLQGEKGAIFVDDDVIELAEMRATDGPDVAQGAVRWDTQKISVASHWMDASHVTWFNSLFDLFKKAIGEKVYFGKEALDALWCIRVISTAYRSSEERSLEHSLEGI